MKRQAVPPEELLAGPVLLRGKLFNDRIEVSLALRDVRTLRRDVPVMETVVIKRTLLHEFEECPDTCPGILD